MAADGGQADHGLEREAIVYSLVRYPGAPDSHHRSSGRCCYVFSPRRVCPTLSDTARPQAGPTTVIHRGAGAATLIGGAETGTDVPSPTRLPCNRLAGTHFDSRISERRAHFAVAAVLLQQRRWGAGANTSIR